MSDETAGLLEKPLTLTWGYYRQPNGWITASAATELEELQYRKGGWQPLPQYGRIEMLTQYAANHPLEGLFLRGGAHELPVEQVIQMGLALNPPLVPTCRQTLQQYHKGHTPACWDGAQPVEFPQLKGMSIPGPFPCRFCDEKKPTEQARDQHEGVAHKDEKGDIRTGETLANAMLRGQNLTPDPQLAILLEQLAALQREMESMKEEGARRRGR